MKTLLIILALQQLPSMTAGDRDSLDKMVAYCNSPLTEVSAALAACTYYLEGYTDLHLLFVELGAPALFCPPDNYSLNDARKAFLKWASANTDLGPMGARIGVLMALREAYPCE